ncbi:hypothetical protein TPAR_05034, partial [Tolypocladium paradoxum]
MRSTSSRTSLTWSATLTASRRPARRPWWRFAAPGPRSEREACADRASRQGQSLYWSFIFDWHLFIVLCHVGRETIAECTDLAPMIYSSQIYPFQMRHVPLQAHREPRCSINIQPTPSPRIHVNFRSQPKWCSVLLFLELHGSHGDSKAQSHPNALHAGKHRAGSRRRDGGAG